MKKSDLYREWARVLDMCEGTKVKPFKCVKGNGAGFLVDPSFDASPDINEFAVAILEDKPVFVGDELYWKSNGRRFDWDKGLFEENLSYSKYLAWQPPNKTFKLNGEELPCPALSCDHNTSRYLTIRGVNEIQFTFHNKDDRDKVAEALIKLLKDATK